MGRGRRRLAALVQTDEGGIDGEAREAEIVEVTAEGRGPVLRREGQADVGVFPVGVELELAAAVQADHLAALAGVTAAGPGLDAAGLGVAGLGEGLARPALARPVHPLGDICDVGQDLGRAARAFKLFLARARGEAGLGIIDGLGRQVGDTAGDAVVVGHHQALARDDARRTATEFDRRQPDPVQPGLVDAGAERRIGAGDGEVVEGPHPFLGPGGRGDGEGQGENGEGGGEVAHGLSPPRCPRGGRGP